MANIWHQRSLVEHAPGRFKALGELTVEEHAAMQELAGRSNELRAELAAMLVRLGEASRANPGRFSPDDIPGEVTQACADPDELSYLRIQRAVDAMRAAMAALGLEVTDARA